jgi:hypothetical protein
LAAVTADRDGIARREFVEKDAAWGNEAKMSANEAAVERNLFIIVANCCL